MNRIPLACLVALIACSRGGEALGATPASLAEATRFDDVPPLSVPAVGSWSFRVVSPTVLELFRVETQEKGGRPPAWDWVRDGRATELPAPGDFQATVDGRAVAIEAVGFARRVLYAPLARRDLRVANRLILRLSSPAGDGATVRVVDVRGKAWTAGRALEARADPGRRGPAVHASQVGYAPGDPKRAYVGAYLGSLGELSVDPAVGFTVVEEGTGREVFRGTLARRPDRGFETDPLPYQAVLEADFAALDRPGTYRVRVPGLGQSDPFRIDPGIPAAFARTLALGVYHARCGAPNDLPFTRFTHQACHLVAAEVPTPAFRKVQEMLAADQRDRTREPGAGPPMGGIEAALYPFVRAGRIDVSGGHHDAGDYSRYTTDSAQLVHALVLAVDAFPGVDALDNLGLPESGDGVPDLAQVARWEVSFLAKLQDDDGGFFFLVYPRDRRYENDVLPDRGDPQVVFPKNTAATAAAVAALAQAGSSPRMRRAWPDDAARWLAQARKGWSFLEKAWAAHGREGAYQHVTHYGDRFGDADEAAWAATELFLATGEDRYHDALRSRFDPGDPSTRLWGWSRLFEGYGAAIRSYVLADRSSRPGSDRRDPAFLARCREELLAGGRDLETWSQASAYGTSFPIENKRFLSAGWYFSAENLFNLVAAWVAEPRAGLLEAAAANLAFEGGANPADTCFLTGLGRHRPRDPVSQYALNDDRVLPPSGLLVGDVRAGFGWMDPYGREPAALSHPPDAGREAPYPMYDRFADAWDVSTEAVTAVQARALAGAAFLMARTPAAGQAWRTAPARIETVPERPVPGDQVVARLVVPGMDLSGAFVVWEVRGQEPRVGPSIAFGVGRGARWIEAEATWPDGRRVSARRDL